MKSENVQSGLLRPTLILTTLIFLSVAPEPDSRDIAEMSANFLVTSNHSALMAASEPVQAAAEEINTKNQ
jgi:hypothetical protein